MKITFDPYDITKKTEIHPLADEKNFITVRQGKLILCCGAKKKRTEGFCKSYAGSGTEHSGYGRCKYCGGCATGPRTEEGKRTVGKKNARKHGLYANYLTDAEQAIFDEIYQKRDVSLYKEISLYKTKIDSYMQHVWITKRAQGKRGLIKTQIRKGVISQYEMGSIEDPHLHKAVEHLRRLIATASSVDINDEENLLDEINAELKAASQQKALNSWGGAPLTKEPDLN